MPIALKVDVDTLRGTREGVPNLLRLLDRFGVQATFLFSLGPDHTGRALKRVFRPGFLKKVSRTSVVEHYGLKTLLYGTVLPGPDIGLKAQAEMRAVQTAGHEIGIHTWDHIAWHDHVRYKDKNWTLQHMQRAYERFVEIFKTPPSTHGAAGWQMNIHALQQLDDWGMAYASDGRGTAPYHATIEGKTLQHVQLPTTLPTLDELLGTPGLLAQNISTRLLQETTEQQQSHVFTLHAELEGQKLLPIFEQLLLGWKQQGHELMTLATYYSQYRALHQGAMATSPMLWSTVPGRSGELICQHK